MAVDVEIQPAVPFDASVLAYRLRSVEADEVRACTGREPHGVILDAIKDSDECWSVFFNGELACIFGVTPYRESLLSGRVGSAWLLTTHLVERYAKTFWRLCLEILPALLDRWDELVNAIDARHSKAVRWAKRLGLRLEEPRPFGFAGLPFLYFSVRKEDLCAPRLA